MKKEVWKAITGYENLYEISNKGKIRLAREGRVYKKGYILKRTIDKRFGYQYVDLYKDGQAKRCFIHLLVLEAFIGPRPKGMEARHLNDIKIDNQSKNLKWGTRKENIADAFRNGIAMCGKGMKRSKKTKKRLSESHKGHIHSIEHCKKISKGLKKYYASL